MRSFALLRPRSALTFLALFLAVAPPAARAAETLGDTLTVIQKPLLNIPAFVTPGGSFTISCEAASGTTGWGAELRHGARLVPLTITNAVYDATTLWWRLTATVPAPALTELYDLRVTAAGGVDDVTRHAVKVLPAYRNDYYFVHITDPHLPTHLYYYEAGAETDSSEVVDLREVIDDVNIINPEFVLLTGDLVNEGELEDYLLRRYYSHAQRVLGEFAVPVFLTSGNHDLGGWDATPPSDGTARRDWWRFFGWKRLANPPAGAPARTQDYSFDYGAVHYVGLEAYNNYDNYLPQYYGTDSFTSAQLQWLGADLVAATGSTSQVLFTHYDFLNQLNLGSLGLEMALMGHTHSNSGSLTTKPYDLITSATCDGKRAYRVVRVSNGVVTPLASVAAGSSGQNLQVVYTPANDGTHDSISASVTNTFPIRFENALLRFVMPHAPGAAYDVVGGTLVQIDDAGTTDVCYVAVDLLAASTRGVAVTQQVTGVDATPPAAVRLAPNHPNPFNPRTGFDFELAQPARAVLAIYDARGARVATLLDADLPAGRHAATWSGCNDRGAAMPSGVYFARLHAAGGTRTVKITLAR
ncbi:MAG: metallophosphoesterase [Candidatus Krumholzibacteriia bacterium]